MLVAASAGAAMGASGSVSLDTAVPRRAVSTSVSLITDLLQQSGHFAREGDYSKAEALLHQALKLSSSRRHPKQTAGVLSALGALYRHQGRYAEALESYNKALALYRQAETDKEIASTLNNIGGVLQLQGKLDEALPPYEQALAIRRKLRDSRGQAGTLTNIGACYFEQGRYAKALGAYDRARAALQEAGHAPRTLGAIVNNMGLAQAALGQYGQALGLYQQALTLRREANDREGIGVTLHNIGFAYYELGQPTDALDFYRQARAARLEAGDKAGAAETLNNLGVLQAETADVDAGLKSLNQAVATFRQIGSLAGEARTLDSIGTIYRDTKAYPKALENYRLSLSLLRAVGDRAAERITLANIGATLDKMGQAELAIIYYKQSVNLTEAIRGELEALPLEQQKTYAAKVSGTYRRLADLLLGRDRILEAQRVLDLLKVQEVEDYVGRVRGTEDTARGVPALPIERKILERAERDQERAIANGKALEELRSIPQSERTADQRQRIVELDKLQRDQARQFVEFVRSPEVRSLLAQLGPKARDEALSLAALRGISDDLARLGQNAVLLYPLILPGRLELVLATPYAPPVRHTVKVGRQQINSAILTFRQALTDRAEDAAAPAQKLYSWIVKPIEPDLTRAHAETILYAPDGQLRYIPLAALYDGKQWLAERFRVQNITAMSLGELNTRPASKPNVLAGAFAHGSFDLQVGGEHFHLPGLPFAGQEVANLAAIVPQTTELLDRDFTPEATVPQLNEHNIIHLATHAALLPGNAEDSFILFGNGEPVTLRDLESWYLTKVDLIVLSACDTGLGQRLGNGEEVLGFGYEVEEAGARAALASLWSVDDGGTQALMSAFYAALEHPGATKAEALKEAQVALINGDSHDLQANGNGPRGVVLDLSEQIRRGLPATVAGRLSHPYYWAPFILIGNGL